MNEPVYPVMSMMLSGSLEEKLNLFYELNKPDIIMTLALEGEEALRLKMDKFHKDCENYKAELLKG